MIAPTLDRERLAKLCGLFGSDHPGERANAAAMADSLLRQAGLRWPDVILPAPPPTPRREPARSDLWWVVQFCVEHPCALTDWEIGFVANLSRRQAPLTEKQSATLQRIVAKCRRASERAAA